MSLLNPPLSFVIAGAHASLSFVETCIFCTNPADSKEDLFPRWVLERVKTRELLSRKVGDGAAELTEDQEVRIPCVCRVPNPSARHQTSPKPPLKLAGCRIFSAVRAEKVRVLKFLSSM